MRILKKKDASKDFKDLKNKVKSNELKDIVKELERAIFGYDDENESSGSGLKISHLSFAYIISSNTSRK